MYKSLINHLERLFLSYGPVHTFRYQSKMLNNAQNAYKGFQVYVEDSTYSRLNITTNIFIVELNIWVLSQSNDKMDILSVQDVAYSICNSVLNRVDYSGASLYDYSIATVSHVTDDDSAGARLTVQLQVPLDGLCVEDEWREVPYDQSEKDVPIRVDIPKDKEITITRKKLERIPVEQC